MPIDRKPLPIDPSRTYVVGDSMSTFNLQALGKSLSSANFQTLGGQLAAAPAPPAPTAQPSQAAGTLAAAKPVK